jgi:hypothetical protein
MHPLFLLVVATFALVLGFLVWNKMSVKKHSFQADKPGIGGSADPISGKGADVRSPDEMRASLDAAVGATSGAADAIHPRR